MFQEIDEIAMEVWSEGGTLGDLLAVLSDEQVEYFTGMLLSDFVSEEDEFKFGFEVVTP
jgi:hypothetical protein